jgi:hypothetical protein
MNKGMDMPGIYFIFLLNQAPTASFNRFYPVYQGLTYFHSADLSGLDHFPQVGG